MGLFQQKKPDLYDNDADEKAAAQERERKWMASKNKVKSGIGFVGEVFVKSIKNIFKVFHPDEEDPLYDYDAVDKGKWTPNRICTWVVNGVNITYGLIGGFIMQNYLAYRSLRFIAFAAGVDFATMHDRSLASPVTVLMDIVFFFVFYLSLIVMQAIFYVVFKFLFQEHLFDPEDTCQVGFMYGVLCIVLSSLIGIVVPINVFM